MDEAAWLACTNVRELLEHYPRLPAEMELPAGRRVESRDRKLRLFAAGVCRLLGDTYSCGCVSGKEVSWDNIVRDCQECGGSGRKSLPPACLAAVDAAERYADGKATWEETREADREAVLVSPSRNGYWDVTLWVAEVRQEYHYWLPNMVDNAVTNGVSLAAQADLFREVFANPYRPGPNLVSVRWGYQHGLVLRLAEAAYEERLASGLLNPGRLAILADAMEESGCTNSEVLGHLRSPGPHVRGCWVLDVILGRR